MNPPAPRHATRVTAGAIFLALLSALGLMAEEPRLNPPKLERNPAAATGGASPAPARNIDVRFPGATRFNETQLRGAIADQINQMAQEGVNAATADDAGFFLAIFYRKNGYANVEVTPEGIGARSVSLRVKEGTLTTLGPINFRGVKGLPEATLRDYIAGTTRERFPNPKVALPFVQSDVDTGVDRIRGLYASEGYLDAKVDPAQVHFSSGKTSASVVVTVSEGIRYRFGKINFSGDLVYYPNTGLLNQLKPFTSKPYTPQQVINMERAVVYYYKTQGYYDPKVDVQADPKTARDGSIPVTFTIASGAVYRFDGVSQEGLERLSPKFLPNRFATLHGKFYNPQLLDEKFREIMQTGLFRQVRIEPRPLPDDTIELHLRVEEEKAKELGFSFGYGTFEGPIIGLVAADRDLFGRGRPLTANLELSANFLRGEILYSDPWLLESMYHLQLRLYGQSEQWYRYSVLETGFRPEISRDLTKTLTAALFLSAREVSTTDQGIDPADFGPSQYFVSSIGASLSYDSRQPDKLSPRSGVVADVVTEVASAALASSVEFVRASGRVTWYVPVTSKTLLALGARAGWMQPLSGNAESIPINERFFNGGSRSVRSFPERRLGPSDHHGYTTGGDTFTTFNAEYQFPVYGSLIGAVFADAGSVGADPSTMGRMRYAAGPGIRYASPVGPLRVDLGINPDRQRGERHFMLHISFGMAF